MSSSHSWKGKHVVVTGGDGFVGRTLVPMLETAGATVFVPLIEEFDLTTPEAVERLFSTQTVDIVLHLAADVGGIAYMREHPGSLLYNNLMMNTLLLEAARNANVEVFVGVNTVNVYPHDAVAPFSETNIWQGLPDENVVGYGMAKRMMILQAGLYRKEYGMNVRNVIIDSIYGPNDVFTEGKSRVIPANIKRFADAVGEGTEEVVCWGSGSPLRDFVYVEDAARAIMHVASYHESATPVNIGTGDPVTIKQLVETIARLTGYAGTVSWDVSKPDGQEKRYLDTTKAKKIGFSCTVNLEDGLKRTIDWYAKHQA